MMSSSSARTPVSTTYALIPCDSSLPLTTVKSFPLLGQSSPDGNGDDDEHDDDEHRGGEDMQQQQQREELVKIILTREGGGRRRGQDNPKESASAAAEVCLYHSSRGDGGCNVRATTLAAACGLRGRRLYGDACVGRRGLMGSRQQRRRLPPRQSPATGDDGGELPGPSQLAFHHGEVELGCLTPDVRTEIASSLPPLRSSGESGQREQAFVIGSKNDHKDGGGAVAAGQVGAAAVLPAPASPQWLADAAAEHYRDMAMVAALARAMRIDGGRNGDAGGGVGAIIFGGGGGCDDGDGDDGSSSSSGGDDASGSEDNERGGNEHEECDDGTSSSTSSAVNDDGVDYVPPATENTRTLCLHCRRPASALCPGCKGAYFCDAPRTCVEDGWPHRCLCPTWKLYVQRREALSFFPHLPWAEHLTAREFQISEAPYRSFLRDELGVLGRGWWVTETTDGWRVGLDRLDGIGGHADGTDGGISLVDPSLRRSYLEGFTHAIPESHRPPPTPVDVGSSSSVTHVTRDDRGLLALASWGDYYAVRNLPPSSPVALLLTFPLTVYHSIQKYGEVPLTVANMLGRPLRVHLVGTEKELNFLDLFAEVGYLLPEKVRVELTFVVRKDMLPPRCRDPSFTSSNRRYELRFDLTPNLILFVTSGTYGGDDLDPNFDCGTGPPDMIVGMNAGLYAYESWRSVVEYLDHCSGVVGVFSDYNEHSGTNCAALGGGASRESLYVNPFRQPRAMPVFCMNLPQFSNGFLYVYNAQELDT